MWKAAAPAPHPAPAKMQNHSNLHKQIRRPRCEHAAASNASPGSPAGNFGRRMKFSPQLERKQAWGAVADRLAVDLYHRHDEVRRRCDEGLPRALGFLDAEGTLDEFDPLSLQEVDERGAGDAAQDGVVDLPRTQPTLTVDDPGVR